MSRLRRRVGWTSLLLVVLLAALTGCGRYADQIGPGGEVETFALYGPRTIEQRFVAHHAGLVGIAVMLQAAPGSGSVTLRLREDGDEATELAATTIVLPASDALAYHFFALPVQDDINGQSFLLRLEAPQATPDSAVRVPYSPGTSGELGLALDGDLSSGSYLAFQLHYDPVLIVKDLVRQASTFGLRASWLLFLSALFYLLPGGALVVWLLREGDWIEKMIVALGMSVAVYALLVYATMTGLRLGRGATYGFLALCAGLIALRWWLDGRPLPSLRGAWAGVRADPALVALAVVVVLVVGVRIWVTRDMVAPRWGDSYQHTVIAQLLVDNGGLFETWEPYAPYTGLTTHFGFHANVALFHWLSGQTVIQSVIWIGQILNALAVLALYPLGNRIGDRWAGVVTILVAGLLSPTPMVYVNWGRYPQLAAQVLLPLACWLLWMLLADSRPDWRLVVVTVVPTAGQFLIYYRMPYYFAAFLAALVLCVYLPSWQRRWRLWGKAIWRIGLVGPLSILLLVPWGLRIASGQVAGLVIEGITRGPYVDLVRVEYAQWLSIGTFVSLPLLTATAVALLWAVLQRSGRAIAVGVWGSGLFSLVAARFVRLPGAALLTAFASMILMYAPVSLLVGWLGEQMIHGTVRRWAKMGRAAVVVALACLSLVGALRTILATDAGYDLVKAEDWRAMAWIREHTPPDARFLVNGFLVYNDTSIVGSDAGWWIPLLTRRSNTIPPQYALISETETEPGYGRSLVQLVTGLQQTPVTTSEGLRLACEEGITHVYIGQGEGRVGSPDPAPLFTADELRASAAFDALYHQGRVWVFALRPDACAIASDR